MSRVKLTLIGVLLAFLCARLVAQIALFGNTVPTQGAQGGGGNNFPVTLQFGSTSGSTVTSPDVLFRHEFAEGDIPTGHIPVLTYNATNVVYTVARKNTTWPDGSWRGADFILNLGANIPAGGQAMTINQTTGSVNTTLPAGKTVAQVVTDIRTNFSTVSIRWTNLTNESGATEGSGTWLAHFDQGLAQGTVHDANDQAYRVIATGPTALELEVWARFADNVGGAIHANIYARLFLIAHLNQSTGAVTTLQWRAWVDQDLMASTWHRYQGQLELQLNTTTVRSWGLAADNRNQTVSSVSGNSLIFGTSGFLNNEEIQLSSTGTLPAPLTANTHYWVLVVNSTTINVCLSQAPVGEDPATCVPEALTSAGSGTITVQGFVRLCPMERLALADSTGQWDWHNTNTGAFMTRPAVSFIHNVAYYRKAGAVPPIDLSVNMNNPTSPYTVNYSPGVNGSFRTDYGTGGAHIHVGTSISEQGARAIRYRNDWTGYVQTDRVEALCLGTVAAHLTADTTTWRLPMLNRDALSGLTNKFSSWMSQYGVHSPDMHDVTGLVDDMGYPEISHWPELGYTSFIFEGGQDIQEMLFNTLTWAMMNREPDSGFYTARNCTAANGCAYDREYIKPAPTAGDTRSDAHASVEMVNAYTESTDGDPEQTYLKDVVTDYYGFVAYIYNTDMSAQASSNGDFNIGEENAHGPHIAYFANHEFNTEFYMAFFGTKWAWNDYRLKTTNSHVAAQAFGRYFTHLLVDMNCKSWFDSYAWKTKEGPDVSFLTQSTVSNWGIVDSGTIDDGPVAGGLSFTTSNNVVTMTANGTGINQIPLQNGDRVFLTDSYPSGDINHLPGVSTPPTPLSLYTWYFVCGAAANGLSFTLDATDATCTHVIASYGSAAPHVWYFSDVFNRTGGAQGCPTLPYRHNGGPADVNNGYITFGRAAAGYLAAAGEIPTTAFNNADAFFQQESGGTNGPNGFKTYLFMSVVTTP